MNSNYLFYCFDKIPCKWFKGLRGTVHLAGSLGGRNTRQQDTLHLQSGSREMNATAQLSFSLVSADHYPGPERSELSTLSTNLPTLVNSSPVKLPLQCS